MGRRTAILSTLFAVVSSQQVGTYQTETHPSLTWQTCTAAGSCTTTSGSVVIDANWRWIHGVNSYTNCYTGNTWDSTLCPNDTAGAANCALEGAVYDSTYGVTTSGNALTLKYVQNNSNGKNVGSRLYLLSSDTAYQGFNLLAKEFTFDVDVSQLGCGLNGALYFVNMDLDGGTSRFPTNKAGAKYGTGYCDSQCPRDLKFISGQANCDGWTPSSSDVNTGVGGHGSCCDELDVWEANSISAAFTPHPCKTATQTLCSGDACGGTYSDTRYAGTCDPDGCDFNSYRMGNTSYYGPGLIVDTTKPFTVVTQFLTNTGTSSGTLNEIRRFYVQNGKLIPNSYSKVSGVTGNSLTASFCDAQKTAFGDNNTFDANGGFSGMSAGLAKGMVLVMSLWSDDYADMLWLDSTYPTTKSASTPGVARGTCSTTSGDPITLENTVPNSQVIYSNIKFGPINSTYTYTSTAHVV